MIDLEEEFQKLMENATKQIDSKLANGELTDDEAERLRDMINARPDTSRYGERCPEGHTDPDCGWSASMGYHCT
jgi:hypothetical protein